MSFDLDAYLARIALPARPTQDEHGLAATQRAQRLAIPFENLDIPLGRGIRIDSDSVFTKLVTARRGGYCFEQNRLFRDALTAVGFEVRPVLARVWLGASSDAPPPLTHTLNLVTIGGQEWVADAGFGGGYAPPMPLVDGAEVDGPDGARHRLTTQVGGDWLLERNGAPADPRSDGASWERQFSFRTDAVAESDLVMANHWTATAPGTRFTTLKVASIALPTGFASLTDRQYRRRNGTDAAEAVIDDPRVYRLRLSLVFGIDLTAEEIAVLWATT